MCVCVTDNKQTKWIMSHSLSFAADKRLESDSGIDQRQKVDEDKGGGYKQGQQQTHASQKAQKSQLMPPPFKVYY